METIKWSNFPEPVSLKKSSTTAHGNNKIEVSKSMVSVVPASQQTVDTTAVVVEEGKRELIKIVHPSYQTMEVIAASATTNANVRWLIAEFSRLYRPIEKRLAISKEGVTYEKEQGIWWDVVLTKDSIKFFISVPDDPYIKEPITNTIRNRCWRQATIQDVNCPLPTLDASNSSLGFMTLKYNSALALDVSRSDSGSEASMLLENFINTKYYLQEGDMAIFQIGLVPYGEGWSKAAKMNIDAIVSNGNVVGQKWRKKISKERIARAGILGLGKVLEEAVNLVGDLFIPGWEEDNDFSKSFVTKLNQISYGSTSTKMRSEAFYTTMRVVAVSSSDENRKSILRAISSSFDRLSGDNELYLDTLEKKDEIQEELYKMKLRIPTKTGDILCSQEISKIIQIPDSRLQREHQEELRVAQHRSEAFVPKDVFKDGIPFATYVDTDGEERTVSFQTEDKNLLALTRVVIGEPGTGKTSFGVNFSVEAFLRGFGVFFIDAADGKAINNILSAIPPDKLDKVHILDFRNTDLPMGLSLCEAFSSSTIDQVEDMITEELIAFIETVGGEELNMTAKTWVELASKLVFRSPTATIGDIIRVMTDESFCRQKMEETNDGGLIAQWNLFYTKTPEERMSIYDQAFKRLYPITNKNVPRSIFLQSPKLDENGEPIVNFRKWMDAGDLVLIKVNETLQLHNVTAIVTFLITKMNMAVVSREDIPNEDDRRQCFLILDEPDHYIKGSERWSKMLTRYRKYRCGLVPMFHGWDQLAEADRNLPKILRKSGPHYIMFQTDAENMHELRFVYEPEFSVSQIAKGLPEHHALIRLKMYDHEGGVTPAFMAKTIAPVSMRRPVYDNSFMYETESLRYGRPKEEVKSQVDEIFKFNFFSDGSDTFEDKYGKFPKPKDRPRSRQRNGRMGRGELYESDGKGYFPSDFIE